MSPSAAIRYEKSFTVLAKKVARELKFNTSKRIVKNRFQKAAMSEYITKFDPNDLKSSGIPTESIINLYEKYAAGGLGMITTGMILVDKNGREMFPGNLIISKDEDTVERRKAFKTLVNVVQPFDTIILGQIGNIADIYRYFALENIDDSDAVKEALKDVIYVSKYLSDCGFDGCTVVVFPGDLEKNKKLIKDLIKHIRNTVNDPKFVVGIKFSTARLQQANVSKEDSFKLLQVIDEAGYDFVEIAGGSYEFPLESDKDREDRFKEVLHEARKYIKNTAIYVGGGMRRVKTMEKLIQANIVDGISLARPVTAELDLPLKIIGNHVASSLVLPFENDMASGVLASAAQANQAGQYSLVESNKNVNYGIMDLNNPETLKKFEEAKVIFVKKLEEEKAKGKPFPGAITVNL